MGFETTMYAFALVALLGAWGMLRERLRGTDPD